MPNDNSFSGEITITPPLPWGAILSGPPLRDVCLRTVATVVDSGTERTTVTTADAIIPVEARYDGRHIVEDIQKVVDAYGSTHAFAGFIQMQPDLGYGESTPVRYVVVDGRVETVTPRLVWPGEPDPLLVDARAVAGLCCDVLREMPAGLDELFGDTWGLLPDWFTGGDRGRELWQADDEKDEAA